MISILFGRSVSSADNEQSKEWKPSTNVPVPVSQPLHQALKTKKLHDEALQHWLKTNPNASKNDLESFKQTFLDDMSRSATPVPTVPTVFDDNNKSKAQEQPQVLPVRNLNAYFDPENSTCSNVRPSMLMSGKSLIVPSGLGNPLTPQSVRPVNIALSTPPPTVPLPTKTPDTDLASVASSGLSAPPSSAASPNHVPRSQNNDAVAAAFLPLRPPSISTAATPPGISMWPFNSTAADLPSQHPNIVPPTVSSIQPVKQSLTPPTAHMPSPLPALAPVVETPAGISLWPFTNNPQSVVVNPLNGEMVPTGSAAPPSEVGSNASMSSLWPFPSFPPEGMMTSMNPLPAPKTTNPIVDYKELIDQLIKEKAYADQAVTDLEAQRDLDMEATRDLRQQLAAVELELQTERKNNEQLKTQTTKDQEEMNRLRLEKNKLEAEKNKLEAEKNMALADKTKIETEKLVMETAQVAVAAERNKMDMEKRKVMIEKEQTEKEKNALLSELEQAQVDKTEMRRLLLEVRDAYATSLRDNTELKDKFAKVSLPTVTPVNNINSNSGNKDKEEELTNLKNQLAGALTTVGDQHRRLKEMTPTATSTTLNDDVVATLKTQIAKANTVNASIQTQLDVAKNNVTRLHSLLDDVQTKNTALIEQVKVAEGALVMANSTRNADSNVDIIAMKQKQEASERIIADLTFQRYRSDAELRRLKANNEADRIPAQTPSSASIVLELKKEIEAITNKKKSLEAQARIDHETITALRTQIEQYRSERGQSEEADRKRVLDLKVVNDTLLKFALDSAFQEDLRRPLVLVALNCWGGTGVNIPESDLEAARSDDGVARVYPRLKEFEKVCDAAGIHFPVDHIVARKTQLSVQHVLNTFGPDFVAKHHILGGGSRETAIQGGTYGAERLETRDIWHETRRGSRDSPNSQQISGNR